MRCAASSLGVRTALITGLVVLMLGPATAAAADCPGQLELYVHPPGDSENWVVASTVTRGATFLVMYSGGPNYEHYTLLVKVLGFLEASHQGNTNVNGIADDQFTMPEDSFLGDGVVSFAIAPGCVYTLPITVVPALSLNPGATVTTVPVFNPNPGVTLTTTTTITTTTTTTTTVPATPAGSSTTLSPATAVSEASTTTVPLAAATTSESSTSSVASTSTTLVAASSESSDQGPPWTVWVVAGLVSLALVAAVVLTVVRRRGTSV